MQKHEAARQTTSSPSKANSITKDLNNSEKEEISNIEFQKIVVRVVNDLKEDTQKLVSDLKEDVDKQLSELKEIQTNR
jgi:hypothetical protein